MYVFSVDLSDPEGSEEAEARPRIDNCNSSSMGPAALAVGAAKPLNVFPYPPSSLKNNDQVLYMDPTFFVSDSLNDS